MKQYNSMKRKIRTEHENRKCVDKKMKKKIPMPNVAQVFIRITRAYGKMLIHDV